MICDPKWEEAHAKRQWGQYPKEELVRWVARNYYGAPDRKAVHFLDLGCGAGASTHFLKREGFTVTSVDGSESAIKRLGAGIVTDATNLPFSNGIFDVVVDVLCLAHNPIYDIYRAVDEIARVLKPNGRVFSVLPDSTFNYDGGAAYRGYGHVHLFDSAGAFSLFAKRFDDITIDWTASCDGDKYTKDWFVKAKLKGNIDG